MGSFFLMYLLTQTLAGNLSERLGNVPTALLGSGLASLGALFYLSSFWILDLLFVGRIFHGAGAGLVSAGVLIHLVESVPPDLKGRMMGYFGLPGFVMLGAGPFLSQFLQNYGGLELTFLFILLSFVLIALILSGIPRPLTPRRRPSRFSRALKLNFPKLKRILSFSLLFGFCFSSWQSFLAPAVSHIGMGAVSTFGLGYGMGAVASRLGISRRLERGLWRLLGISSLILYGLMIAVTPHLDHVWQFATVGFICGMSHGLYYPGLSSIAAERFHPLVPGHGMSLYISASSLGLFVGPPVWGFFADRTNYFWTFAATGLLLASATLVFLVAELRQHRHSNVIR